MKCLICGNQQFGLIHNGTRDITDVNVMKCSKCGMVQLDSQDYNTENNYVGGGMLKNSYSLNTDTIDDISWDTWIEQTKRDDDRRYSALKDMCTGKSVLEFGCGNGGFLRRIRTVAGRVTGVELMNEARQKVREEGIEVYKTLSEANTKYDIICSFMVIEHLNNPDEILKQIFNALNENGIFICETVNAEDALISKYHCKDFEDFTYWSEHVYLYDSVTLEKLLTRNGFKTKWNTQIQRYSLANHLFWLSHGKPGGHAKWTEFNGQKMNEEYEKALVALNIADTLWYAGTK